MIKSLVKRKLASAEKELGGSLDYVRHILDTSFRAFLKFTKILGLSEYRGKLAPDPYHVARLVATRDEDCGTCLQIEVNLARKDGLDPAYVRAVLDRRPQELPAELADTYRFADSVVTASGDEAELRERMRTHWDEEGLVELGLAMASARFFPIMKRTLGYATSCSKVTIQV